MSDGGIYYIRDIPGVLARYLTPSQTSRERNSNSKVVSIWISIFRWRFLCDLRSNDCQWEQIKLHTCHKLSRHRDSISIDRSNVLCQVTHCAFALFSLSWCVYLLACTVSVLWTLIVHKTSLLHCLEEATCLIVTRLRHYRLFLKSLDTKYCKWKIIPNLQLSTK